MQMITAIGAKNGWLCPKTSVATNQASAAATAHWMIGSPMRRSARTRRRTPARTRARLTRTKAG